MAPLLDVRELSKTFRYRTGWFHRQQLTAVKSVSFTLQPGETLAVIGENGSGKSTLARMLGGIIAPSAGEIRVNDHPLHFRDYAWRCRHIRMIFQDPATALNPRQRIGKMLEIPLRLNTEMDAQQREKRIHATLRQVGLLPDYADYYPHMLAPGQKQRVGLARALILRPQILIADEALTTLDMSVRAQLINLMLELQETHHIAYVYITQHLGLMEHISDQVLVMHQGEIIERGSAAEVLANPQHPQTQRLVASHFGGRSAGG